MKLKHIVSALAIAAISLPAFGFSFGFDKYAAQRTSASLSEEQMAQSWQLFQAGYQESIQGDPIKAAFLVRRGLVINPAEPEMHKFAASLFELGGADGYALAHWSAVFHLLFDGSGPLPEVRESVSRLRTRLDKTDDRQVGCKVLGIMQVAGSQSCDDPGDPNARPNHAGFDYVRVHAYSGPRRAAKELATVYAVDTSPNWGTAYICKINGALLSGGVPASVVYLLPGSYLLGWCYGPGGKEAKGQYRVTVVAKRFYQVAVQSYGNGGYPNTFFEMPMKRLVWRDIAPAKTGLPGSNAEVPLTTAGSN